MASPARRVARPDSRRHQGEGAICRIEGAAKAVAAKTACGFSLARFQRPESLHAGGRRRPIAAGRFDDCWSLGCRCARSAATGMEGADGDERREAGDSRRGGGSALLAALALAGAAGATQPEPWEINLQPAATPIMEMIHRFNDGLLIVVGADRRSSCWRCSSTCMVRFNARANPVPSRTTHNTLIEVIWTVVPILILVGIAVPSFALLFAEHDPARAIAGYDPAKDKQLTIKATGNQWYWSYEYPDNGDISFDSLHAAGRTSAQIRRRSRACSPSTTRWSCRSAPSSACRSSAPTSSIRSRCRRSASRSTPFPAASTRPGSAPTARASTTASARSFAARRRRPMQRPARPCLHADRRARGQPGQVRRLGEAPRRPILTAPTSSSPPLDASRRRPCRSPPQ